MSASSDEVAPIRTFGKALLATIMVLAGLIYVNYEFSFRLAVVVFAALVTLSFLTDLGDPLSVAFWLSGIAFVALLFGIVLPPAITRPLEPVLITLGLPTGQVDALFLFVWAVLIVVVVWLVDIRFISRTGKKPTTVAKRLRTRAEDMVETYVTLTRILAVGLLGLLVIVLGEAGVFAGEVGNLLATEPFAASNLWAMALGFLALGGELPVIGSVPPFNQVGAIGFAVLSGIVIVVAAMVYYR